jgi:hypothetical protein
MTATFTEVLPATRSDPHAAIRFTPADPDRQQLLDGLPVAGELQIQGKRTCCRYAVVEFPTPWAGRAFRLVKAAGEAGSDPSESAYDVFCGRNGHDRLCQCKGFTRWGHCRHTAAAEALVANGWI